MAKIPYQDPGSTEVQSPLISGITDALNKISGMINMPNRTDTVALQEVYIAADDRFRIYKAPPGQQNWERSPEPVIRKNGNIINPTIDFYTIDYVGGAIIFAADARQTLTDEFTADVTFITEGPLQMPLKADLDPDTNKLISSQIPDTLATKEELKPIQDKVAMDKGYFEDAEQLTRTYPAGEIGWHAVVGTTDTVWIWDADTGAWKNSGTSDITASKVPFVKSSDVDATNVQDAIENVGINKANKDLTNIENATFKSKANSSGLAYQDLTNVTDTTFKQKGNQAGLATKDLANVENSIFKAKGNTAGLSYADLSNVNNTTFKNKGDTVGLATSTFCTCVKNGTVWQITSQHPIPDTQKIFSIYYITPGFYRKGDTFTFNGVSYFAQFLSIGGLEEGLLNDEEDVFNGQDLVAFIVDTTTKNMYLYSNPTAFRGLNNVSISSMLRKGLESNLQIQQYMNPTYDSATDTITLNFLNYPLNYNPLGKYTPSFLKIYFKNSAAVITKNTKFAAPNKSGSIISYEFILGNSSATNFPVINIPIGAIVNATLDFASNRIIVNPSELFVSDYNNKGIQLYSDLRLKNTGNYGSILRFGDGEYAYIKENTDDDLLMVGTNLTFTGRSRGIKLTTEANGPININPTGSGRIYLSPSGAGNVDINTASGGKATYNGTEIAKVDLSNTTDYQISSKLNANGRFQNFYCTATKSGTVFTLTFSKTQNFDWASYSVTFIAPANFNAGDTFVIVNASNSYTYTPYSNGAVATKGFKQGDLVTCNVNITNRRIFFKSSGGIELPSDYTIGGVILKSDPDNIRKITQTGKGDSVILNSTIKSSNIGRKLAQNPSGSSDGMYYVLAHNMSNLSNGLVYALLIDSKKPGSDLIKLNAYSLNVVQSVPAYNLSTSNVYLITVNSKFIAVYAYIYLIIYNKTDLSTANTFFLTGSNYSKMEFSPFYPNIILGIDNYQLNVIDINDGSETNLLDFSTTPYKFDDLLLDKTAKTVSVHSSNGYWRTYDIVSEKEIKYNSNIEYGVYYKFKNWDWVYGIKGVNIFTNYMSYGGYTFENSFALPSNPVGMTTNYNGKIMFVLQENGELRCFYRYDNNVYYAIMTISTIDNEPFTSGCIMTIDENSGTLVINQGKYMYYVHYKNEYVNYTLYD